MEDGVRVLIVEDQPSDAGIAEREIKKALKECAFRRVETREDYLAALQEFRPDLIVSDYSLPGFDGLTALKFAQELMPLTPLIILTGSLNEDTAVECVKAGASNYVIKEHIKRLGQSAVHALKEKQLREDRRRAEENNERLEAQLQQAQKMESVGRLAGGVAHDFNNMLCVILGYAELIKARLPLGDPILRDINEIERAAGRARDITRQLLAFSRKQIIAPRPVNLNDLIADTQKSLGRLIGEDVELTFAPGKDLWRIKFDPSQAEQILINLAVNARDAMPKGGKLTIETRNVCVDDAFCRELIECSPGQYVMFAVSDNGSGMDAETRSKAFDPFFTTKEKGKGTGLGLSTVYGIVKQNQGFITLDSEPGRGAAFKIFLPRIDAESHEAEEVGEAAPVSGAGVVLLVEDDAQVCKMTTMMLETLGYTVMVAGTPKEAIARSKHKQTGAIDLLVTDVVMPGLSGKELRDKIEAVKPGIKTLFMSGYTTEAILHHGVAEEGGHFIQKPFSMNELARKVRQVLGHADTALPETVK